MAARQTPGTRDKHDCGVDQEKRACLVEQIDRARIVGHERLHVTVRSARHHHENTETEHFAVEIAAQGESRARLFTRYRLHFVQGKEHGQ
jgi:hypothetical protein